MPETANILLTVLGTRRQLAKYELQGRFAEAEMATAALLELLPAGEGPNEIVALCTPEAERTTWPILVQTGNHPPVRKIAVPSGETPSDMETFLRNLLTSLPSGAPLDLTVDLTHGFRHFSFLLYTGILYLTALRGVRLGRAYYALLKKYPEASPFLDLQPLLALPDWFAALQTFGETGDIGRIVRLLDEREKPSGPSMDVRRRLTAVSTAYSSGLPLELGRASAEYLQFSGKQFVKVLKNNHGLPLATELGAMLAEFMAPFSFGGESFPKGWKAKLELDEHELRRQVRIVDGLFDQGHIPLALGLMREWVVTWASFIEGKTRGALTNRETRQVAATRLHALRTVAGDPDLASLLDDGQRGLAAFWARLSNLRNAFHHHGFRAEPLVGGDAERHVTAELEKLREYWATTLRHIPRIPLDFARGESGPLLITPLGRRPGVVYSALETAKRELGPETPLATCVVLTSKDVERSAEEAFEVAGFRGERVIETFEDPYGGMGEIDTVVHRLKLRLAASSGVLVNVTGGTTLLGLAADRLAEEAGRFGHRVRRFGLIDTRSPAEQEQDPYQPGTPFWLDREEETEA